MFTLLYRCPFSGDLLAEETTDDRDFVNSQLEEFDGYVELVINEEPRLMPILPLLIVWLLGPVLFRTTPLASGDL